MARRVMSITAAVALFLVLALLGALLFVSPGQPETGSRPGRPG
jgi:hypothetical protein